MKRRENFMRAGQGMVAAPGNGMANALSESDRRQLVAELFHALSQPLTALRCSLEMALSGRFSPGPSQENLRLALEHAEQIAHLATGIRELVETEGPGGVNGIVNLESSLGEAVMDLVPVAESAGVRLGFHAPHACPVLAEPRRLRQALFYLVESALAGAEPGESVQVQVGERERQAIVLVTVSRSPAAGAGLVAWPGAGGEGRTRDLGRRLGLAIASRTFEAAGGSLYVEEDERTWRLRLRLPLAAKAS
jgi:signal transduction histidine kinase